MFGFYDNYIYPKLMSFSLRNPNVMDLRKQIISKAYGNILEIGIGEGTNLPLYPIEINEITAVDNFIHNVPSSRIKVNLVNESACDMSFSDNTFDTVVSTFCLCSVDNPEKALSEIYRVLKPNGQFLFLEHGKAPFKAISVLQNIFNPIYNIFAYGCNINRDHIKNIQKANFKIKKCKIVSAAIFPSILTGYAYIGKAIKSK